MPDWLPPGVTHVEHIDLGDGSFRFTMSVRHRWLGQVFWQSGRFRDPGAGREKKGKLNSAAISRGLKRPQFAALLTFPCFLSRHRYSVSQSLKIARAFAPSNVRRTASIACSVARSP